MTGRRCLADEERVLLIYDGESLLFSFVLLQKYQGGQPIAYSVFVTVFDEIARLAESSSISF